MSPRLQSETARQRELYKYWQPNESIFPSAEYDETFNRDYQPRPSYDSALTAYAQLGALRCNAKRGMVSVVDQNYQYIIAEGTKTLSLQDGTVTDQDDQLWFGLRTIPRSVGICARALGQFTDLESHDGSIPDTVFAPLQFVIPDLSKDPRFEMQPFVCGTPYLRFYAGVPIRSPTGHIIGIYSIVDDKARHDFGDRDLDILKDLAATVMDHLVLGTVRGRHHRADRMVKGLGLFVEGKESLRDWWLRSGHLAHGPTTADGSKGGWTLKARTEAEFGPQAHTISSDHTPIAQDGCVLKSLESDSAETRSSFPTLVDAAPYSVPSGNVSSDPVAQGLANPSTQGYVSKDAAGLLPVPNTTSPDSNGWEDGDSSKKPGTETLTLSQDMAAIFRRASNLIRESITVEGCVLLDASGATTENVSVSANAGEQESTLGSASSERRSTNRDESLTRNIVHGEGERGRKPVSSRAGSSPPDSMCDVLGYSSKFDFHLGNAQAPPSFQFPKDTLHRLLKRYPNGSILNFEQNDGVSSSEEELGTNLKINSTLDEGSSRSRNQKKQQHFKEVDSQIIMEIFPGIRRLAFFPLWDTSTKTWFCGALAWTNDPLRVLDAEDDMAYLAAFGNSIMAEKARLDASMADRMKSNFISTVSHELRSPLHGILASAELLKDMSLSAAQMDMINMINTCGRTLLDTINHVLDFTELNRLRKSRASDKKKKEDRDASKSQSQSPPILLKQTTQLDLSLLVEEVVDSTLMGHDFSQSSYRSADVPGRTIGNVKVVMDIDWCLSWVFSIQPGAWRRIVMNLFGNALKYTQNGYVCVSLKSLAGVLKQNSQPLAILTVSDTGKGISKQFLKHHIFKPFWQEDTLATGTGLGLSIVQQIVRDLDGRIEIKSKEGSGTKVTVQIPFGNPAPTPALNDASSDNVYLAVRQKMKGLKVHIISPKISSQNEKNGATEVSGTGGDSFYLLRNLLCKTLKSWFEMEIVEAQSVASASADVYLLLTDEPSILDEKNSNYSSLWTPEVNRLAETNVLMILCTAPTSSSNKTSAMHRATHFIPQPFGPHKLANAFDAFLKRKEAPPTQPAVSQPDSMSTYQLPPNSISIASAGSDYSIPSSNTPTSALDLKSMINSLSTTTTAVMATSPQLVVSSQPLTVLLVEDNEINLKILIMYMRKLKKPFQTAVNGLEALQAFKKNPLSLRLILMDITMPVMDGLAATREIRRHEQELGLPPATIVALTGASSANAREQAIVCGVDEFFTKPVPLSVVRSLVVEWKQQPAEDRRGRKLTDA